MTKTIREWFEELPGPQRTEAIENTKCELDNIAYSLSGAIGMSFRWDQTPQGHTYWMNIYDEIGIKESNQSKP